MFRKLYKRIKEWFMSFFIGKDTSDRPAVIITNSPTAESSIKSSIPNVGNRFKFDSRLPLIEVVEHLAYPSLVSTTGNGLTYKVYSVSLPTGVSYSLTSNSFLMFYNNYSKQVSMGNPHEFVNVSSIPSFYYSSGLMYISTTDTLTNVNFLELSYTKAGVYTGSYNSNTSIHLTNDEFSFSGFDLLNSEFIVSGAVNSQDLIINSYSGPLQIVNSVGSVGALGISTNNSNVKIVEGSRVILDTADTRYSQLYKEPDTSSIRTVSVTRSDGNPYTIPMDIDANTKHICLTIYPYYNYDSSDHCTVILDVTDTTTEVPILHMSVPTTPGPQPGSIVYTAKFNSSGNLEISYTYFFFGDPIGGGYSTVTVKVDYFSISYY